MNARFIGAVAAVVLTVSSAMAEVSGYAHRIDFSVTGYKGTETLVNFPLIIKLSETIKGFKYSDFLSDGADLRFALKDGTVLQHELESWDTTGTSIAWVKVPAFSNGLELTMYYGKANDTAPEQTVFKDAGYELVLHLDETDGTYADDTGNGYSGKNVSYTESDVTYTPSSLQGFFGNAVRIMARGQNTKGPQIDIDNYKNCEISDTFTCSMWIRASVPNQAPADEHLINSGQFRLDTQYNSGAGLKILDPGCNWVAQLSSNVLTPVYNNGDWHFLTVSFSGLTAKIYYDGTYRADATLKSPQVKTSAKLVLGNSNAHIAFNGDIDEARVHPQVLSADWIAADYDAATDEIGTFLSLYKKTIYVVPPDTVGHTPVAPYYTWETAATDIQTAVDSNVDGFDVKIAPGTYPIASRLRLNNPGVVYTCVDKTTGAPVYGGAVIDAGGTTWTTSAVLLDGASMRGFSIINATSSEGDGKGGGLQVAADSDTTHFIADTVISNCCMTGTGKPQGGGIYLDSGYYGTISNCLVAANSAKLGGGLYYSNVRAEALTVHPTVVDTTFDANVMNGNWGYGGAAQVAGIAFQNCVFSRNRKDAGLDSYSPCVDSDGYNQYLGCTFIGNEVSHGGGGSCIFGSSTDVIRGCVFTGNATMAYAGSSLLENCVFTNNLGVAVKGCMDMRNCLVANNGGAGLWAQTAGTNRIENCTFANNKTYGIQGNVSGTLRTVIVNSVSVCNVKPDYYASNANNDIIITNSVIGTCKFDMTPHDDSQDQNRYTWTVAQVRFTDAANGDYTLQRRSPCRDAGVKLGWMTEDATDLAGNPRVLKNGCPAADALPDLGCYENCEMAPGLLLLVR